MAKQKSKPESRGQRVRLPTRLKEFLPKIHWALLALRQHRLDSDFAWVHVKPEEPAIQPFTSVFDDQTNERIDKMTATFKPPQGSRSTLIITALHYYQTGPKHNEPDKGLR